MSLCAALGVLVAAVASGCGSQGSSTQAAPAAGWPSPVVAATFDGHGWMSAKSTVDEPPGGGDRGNAEFYLVACPAAGSCFAAGSVVGRTDGRVVAGLVAHATQGRWSATHRLPGKPDHPGALSCGSPSLCVAVGSTATYAFDGAAWRRGPSFPGNASRTVACARPDFCVEVQPTTYRYETYQRGAWTSPRAIAPLAGTNILPNLLACAAPRFCLGMNDLGAYWLFDGTGWTPGRRIEFPLSVGFLPKALSCATTSFCVAVGDTLRGEALASFYNGTAWSTPTQVAKQSGLSRLTSISCPAAGFCAAVGTSSTPRREFAVTLDAGRWSSATTVADTQGDPSVACATTTYCVALTGEVTS